MEPGAQHKCLAAASEVVGMLLASLSLQARKHFLQLSSLQSFDALQMCI